MSYSVTTSYQSSSGISAPTALVITAGLAAAILITISAIALGILGIGIGIGIGLVVVGCVGVAIAGTYLAVRSCCNS